MVFHKFNWEREKKRQEVFKLAENIIAEREQARKIEQENRRKAGQKWAKEAEERIFAEFPENEEWKVAVAKAPKVSEKVEGRSKVIEVKVPPVKVKLIRDKRRIEKIKKNLNNLF